MRKIYQRVVVEINYSTKEDVLISSEVFRYDNIKKDEFSL